MSLRTWWIGMRVERIEAKMKNLRQRQKVNREHIERLVRDKGLTAAELDARRGKLEADREKLTREISRLSTDEARLRQQLKQGASDNTAA